MTQPAPAAVRGIGPVVRLSDCSLTYKKTRALDDVSLDIPSGVMAGLIGPDGVGKSSLLSLVAGARQMQSGKLMVLGGDMRSASHRSRSCPRIAYMPQGLGRNLYATLSVFENVDFFGRLFGHGEAERESRIAELLTATGLAPFADRPAGKLSGGMKQKLGLCCALIHDPDLLILDEPTTGVDPLSRRQFWDLIDGIRTRRPGMSVIVATAYMEEAARFDWLCAMHGGKVLDTGTPADLLARTGTADLDAAFIALLPEALRQRHVEVSLPPRKAEAGETVAIEADHLTMRFGDFVAVNDVSFRIPKGEIFGFLGSNGCGKTTTMKMLTGLLAPTEGQAKLFGEEMDANDLATRQRIGYMSQAFSLYRELSVRQNLELHAKLYDLPVASRAARVEEMLERFDLKAVAETYPDALPLGIRQRMSLATAMIHGPDVLILDEPTSGVDPVARDGFWQILGELSRKDGVTIFISTHFMNEAECCDRISLMHAGRVLVTDTPEAIRQEAGAETLEEAFITRLEEASGGRDTGAGAGALELHDTRGTPQRHFSLRRMFSYARREALELQRDRIRATLAILGSVILMFVVGYGINMDVEDLTFAVLDHDDTATSRDYVDQISGSRYFIEQPPLSGYDDMDARMRAGRIDLAIEIPPGFGADLERGRAVQVGAWIDGSMPSQAETVSGYVQGIHAWYLTERAREEQGDAAVASDFDLEMRYRYNPDIRSLNAIAPAVIPLLLMLIPAMLAALSVVREKEMGSITNLYVTPVTRLEFILGKQMPYVVVAMLNYVLMALFAVYIFGVPITGSVMTLTVAAALFCIGSTGFGLVMSSFMNSQIAAIFATALLTMIPAVQYSGMIDPVSSLEGLGAVMAKIFPSAYMVTISRGVFGKALDFQDLRADLTALLIIAPTYLALSTLLLRKQER